MQAQALETVTDEKKPLARFEGIKRELLNTRVRLCPERASLITDYFKYHADRKDSVIIRQAKALRHLYVHKTVRIHRDELIVGNMGSERISAILQPELASIFMSGELLWIDKRKTTPFQMPWAERLKLLLKIYPYWLTRNMAIKAFFPHFLKMLRYLTEQLNATYYLVNEAGGIGHFLPNYEKMINLGVEGYLKEMEGRNGDFHAASRIACEALLILADRFAAEAEKSATQEKDKARAQELKEITAICHKVPRKPAATFHEALQSLWFTHMAANMEGLNSAISFGRIDQYLYPYYKADLEAGRITPDKARELLLLFSAKAVEHVERTGT